MGSTPRKYAQEYKDEAVRLALDSDRSLAEIAKSLGINELTLGNWVTKAKKDSESDEKPLSVSECRYDRLNPLTCRNSTSHATDDT